jgi:TRAP-type C4-dicarboxylate transport system substrate-binding protein
MHRGYRRISFSDQEGIPYYGTDNFDAGLNSHQSTMCDFGAVAVPTNYLQVWVRHAPRICTFAEIKIGKSMFKVLARCALFSFALLPCAASAEPIKLSLSFFTSDRSTIYLAAAKPFVDAVNAEAKGLIEIEVSFSGGNQAEQAKLVLGGMADIAFIVPGLTPKQFPDNAIIEMPGLFRSMPEATLVFTALVAANSLSGYQDFVVIGAFASEPEGIHTRRPVAALDDLKGMKIRANNPTEAAALEKLGMVPVAMPVNLISEAISSGQIDGTALPLSPLVEFGIGRVVANHYFLGVASAPLALVMNRARFDSLPKQAQDIIRKYSGEWVARRYLKTYETFDAQVIEQLKSDPRRKLVSPSPADLDRAKSAFASIVADWAAKSPHNGALLTAAELELAKLRATR